ncbi:MAG: metallophosphoesterase [Muribaculaceae bacterium]|nr:metallophosphoesterase [Muribaculaceae bacterium]
MRINWIALALFIFVNLLVDWAIDRKLRRVSKWASRVHRLLALALQVMLVVGMAQPFGDAMSSDSSMNLAMWLLWTYIAFYVPKYLWLLLAWPSFIRPLPRGLKNTFATLGTVVGLGVFGTLWWGTLVTPGKLQINGVTLSCPRLGQAFDGYRIVQISDLHVGTYGTNTSIVQQMVDSVNGLSPDLILFTGDLVSRRTSEALPFTEVLSQLKARDGVVAILGNHDYDDYCRWPDSLSKVRDHEALCDIQRQMGWTLLNNEHHIIVHDGDSLLVIGEENYGEGMFHNYSDFNAAYPDSVRHLPYKILLQHNPVQWREDIIGKTDIDLTLSGHTHAMQMMVTLFGKKYSPASLRYKEWGGLYSEGNQHLYVNIGIGMVGVPMRIGATPEITVIQLRIKN